jgi:hypothetical protein
MSSPSDPALFSEPLPEHLKAMLELNREAQTSLLKYDWHVLVIDIALIAYFVFIASRPHGLAPFLPALAPFIILLGLTFGLQRTAERRAQRRLQLLLTVIRSLQPREDAAAHP